MGLATALLIAVAAAADAAPALAPSDQAAIMKVVCTAELEKDARGWLCRYPSMDDSGEPWEERWVSARRGRFVAHPDEWLVSLARGCLRGVCAGSAYVVRKVRGSWRLTHEIEMDTPVREDCIQFGRMADGLDRLACIHGAGPHQGFMSERLAVLSFAGGALKVQPLMEKGQGGECFLSPPLPQYQDDALHLQRADATEPQALFVARLRVRRAPCDPSSDEGHGPIVMKAEHRLRFLRRGNEVVPDDASARVIAAEDWSPAGG